MDESDSIGAYELLSLIDKHGSGWPLQAPTWGLNEIGDAISREIVAGNLRDAANLTEQGRRFLIEARVQHRMAATP